MVVVDLIPSPLSHFEILLGLLLPILKERAGRMVEHQIIGDSGVFLYERVDLSKHPGIKGLVERVGVNVRKTSPVKNQIVAIYQITPVINTAAFILV